MDSQEPRALLKVRPYYPRIYFGVAGGVQDWFDMLDAFPLAKVAQTDRGRPNQTMDFVQLRVKEAFADLLGREVEFIEAYEITIVRLLNGGPFIKFNKLDAEKLVHRPNTQRGEDFYYQQLRLSFANQEDSAEGVTVHAGYRLDFLKTKLVDVHVQCQCGDELEWSERIPEPPANDEFNLARRRAPQGPLPGTGMVVLKADGDQKKAAE